MMFFDILKQTVLYKNVDRRLILTIDIIVVALASALAIFLPTAFHTIDYSHEYVATWMGSSVGFALLVFLVLRTYSTIIRHTSVYELWRLAIATIFKCLLMFGVMIFLNIKYHFSVQHLGFLLVMDGLLMMVLLTLERILIVTGYDVMRQQAARRRRSATVLVYGTSQDALDFVETYRDKYNICGFAVKDKVHNKRRILDLPVFDLSDYVRLGRIIDMNDINAIVFVSQNDVAEEEDGLMLYCQENSIRTLFMSPLKEIDGAQPKRREVREVRIEDLLGRSEIELSSEAVKANFKDKVIMVTGSAGSIGSELCRQLATFGIKQLICFDNAETPMHNLRLELEETHPELSFVPVIGDVRIVQRIDWAIRKFRPQIVFHAGAYKHVPLMEENPCEAVLVNVAGSRNVADTCVKYGVEKMIMISTDKAVNPTNIMGCTKRIAEIYVQSLGAAIETGRVEGNTKFITTRFGNVLGSNGSVIPRFREQIAKGGPVTVTHPDITRFFMTIPEACRLVMEAATNGEDNQIFVFDMGRSVKIAHLAKRMIELAGFKPDVDIKIEYTGLRPGEKLYEEVLANEENTIPTENKNIRIARVRQYDYDEATSAVTTLERLSRSIKIDEMVFLMKHVVPEFKSKNSRFEAIDKKIEDEIILLTH